MFDVAFYLVPMEEGLRLSKLCVLLHKLSLAAESDEEEIMPISIAVNNTAAYGFINLTRLNQLDIPLERVEGVVKKCCEDWDHVADGHHYIQKNGKRLSMFVHFVDEQNILA